VNHANSGGALMWVKQACIHGHDMTGRFLDPNRDLQRKAQRFLNFVAKIIPASQEAARIPDESIDLSPNR